MIENKNITFTEFKKWLKNFVISKGGKLPSVADWRVIKTKMDSVIEHDYLDCADANCTNCGQDFMTSKNFHNQIEINNQVAEKCEELYKKVKFATIGTHDDGTSKKIITVQILNNAIEGMNKQLYVEPSTMHNCGIQYKNLMEDTPIDTNIHKEAELAMQWGFDNARWDTSYFSQFE